MTWAAFRTRTVCYSVAWTSTITSFPLSHTMSNYRWYLLINIVVCWVWSSMVLHGFSSKLCGYVWAWQVLIVLVVIWSIILLMLIANRTSLAWNVLMGWAVVIVIERTNMLRLLVLLLHHWLISSSITSHASSWCVIEQKMLRRSILSRCSTYCIALVRLCLLTTSTIIRNIFWLPVIIRPTIWTSFEKLLILEVVIFWRKVAASLRWQLKLLLIWWRSYLRWWDSSLNLSLNIAIWRSRVVSSFVS